MSFKTHVQRPEGDIGLQFYVYIAGIPYIFGSHAQPSHWTIGDYTWNQSLVIDRPGGTATQLRSVGAGVDLQTGSIESGMLTLEFYYDPHEPAGSDVLNPANVWRSLVSPEVRNTVPLDPTKLVRPGDTRFWLSDFSGFTGGQWYAGKETVNFGSYSSTDGWADADGRGLYESQREWFGPRGAQARAFGGVVELTSWPDSWKGREIRVWAAASQMHRGVLTALSSGPRGSECYEVFRGEVANLRIGDDRCTIIIECDSLAQVLSRAVLSRGRTYQIGPMPGGSGWVSLERYGSRYLSISHTTSIGAWGDDSPRLDLDVWTELGGSDRPISAEEIAAFVQSAVRSHFTDGSGNNLRFSMEFTDNDEGERKLKIAWSQYDAVTASAFGPFGTLHIHGDDPHSLWPALGVQGEFTSVGSGTLRGGVETVEWTAPKPVPYYYLGPDTKWLYYRGVDDVDFVSGIQPKTDDPPGMQRTERLSGRADGVYMRLGDSTIAELRMRQETGGLYTVTAGGRDFVRAEVIRVGAVGTDGQTWVVPFGDADDDGGQISALIGFDSHPLLDAVRYMMCSNGDPRYPVDAYNVMPEGFGASIPPGYIDHESWNRVQGEIGAEASGWAILEATNARDLLQAVCRAHGLLPHEKQTATGIKIALERALVPPQSQPSVVTLDDDWFRSDNDAPGADRSELRILNNVSIKYAWDPLDEKWRGRSLDHIDANSVARYGRTQAFVLELPWVQGLSSARTATDPVAEGLLSLWGRPQVEYTANLYNPAALALEPMDIVKITMPYVPNWVEGGFGLVDLYARIVRISKSFGMGDAEEPFAEVTLWPQPDRGNYAPWVPSLRLWYNVSGATYAIRPTVNEGGFADPSDGRTDAEWWASSADDTWLVYAYLPWKDGSAGDQNRSVSAIDTTATPPTITLSSALTGDLATYIGDVVLGFRDFDTSGLAATQEGFVFLAEAPDLGSTVNTYKLTRSDATTIEGVKWR